MILVICFFNIDYRFNIFVVSLKLNDTMADTWFSNIRQSDIESVEFEDITTPNLDVSLEDDLEDEVVEPDDVDVVDEPDPLL